MGGSGVYPVGIGMIGCGGIAQTAHLPAVARLPGLVRLLAVADVSGGISRS